MSTTPTDAERALFEAWAKTQGEPIHGFWFRQLPDGGYSSQVADVMWKAWQTARTLPVDGLDAERYRWLREQQWNTASLFVVAGSKDRVRLGTDCPSLDRLDEAIDAAIKQQETS